MKACMRCKGPTKQPDTCLLDVLCESCTRGNVLPAHPPQQRKWWSRRVRG